jgi:3' terminal RNA ribose 2'-O-methyltransferase Hen1
MLLKITTTHTPATDLGYLLHKNPAKCQVFEESFGKVYVFYPEATEARCTVAMLLDVDPVDMVRGRAGSRRGGMLDQYVNDRPYVASSFLSVAIAQVFGTAMQGRCKDRSELAQTAIPLKATLSAVPSRGGEAFIRKLFEPLGYAVTTQGRVLDEKFPDWGASPYFTVTLRHLITLAELLTHLYVLVPVLDNSKHYYIGNEEVQKLLDRGKGWLASHPERESITKRYLKFQPSLAREALARLEDEDQLAQELATDDAEPVSPAATAETALEEKFNLNQARLGCVLAALRACGAKRVLDLGCGEGHLLRELMKERQFEQIVGLDVSIRSLEFATDKLHLDRLPLHQKDRIKLIHGSLMYRDNRLEGFDAAAVVEVIEHLDPPRLAAFERVLFECARPGTIVLTTPSREYNAMWEGMVIAPAEGDRPATTKLRHSDHRFEWTRTEFQSWATAVAERFGYSVRFLPIGPEDPTLGPPTQMAVFTK